MKKTLHFLQISRIAHVSNFLQHIHQLAQIQLSKGDTYNTLFTKLRERFKDNPVEAEAVNDWISYNIDEQSDKSVFDKCIAEEDGLFAVFDFVPIG